MLDREKKEIEKLYHADSSKSYQWSETPRTILRAKVAPRWAGFELVVIPVERVGAFALRDGSLAISILLHVPTAPLHLPLRVGRFPCVSWRSAFPQAPASPIHFSSRAIAFSLDSSETPQRHAPETMAGGVAVFDYDRDGKPDIFFTNGANINTLKKDSPKYWNRLFHNNGDGTFTDVTEKAGLKGTGFDIGVAIGDYDNDGYDDIFVAASTGTRSITITATARSRDVTEKAGLMHPTNSMGRSGRWQRPGSTSTTTVCSICLS